tara:strand:+ start:2515 stop:2967 length:453 start_codon:yes stop_codon:yes gene_type:complete
MSKRKLSPLSISNFPKTVPNLNKKNSAARKHIQDMNLRALGESLTEYMKSENELNDINELAPTALKNMMLWIQVSELSQNDLHKLVADLENEKVGRLLKHALDPDATGPGPSRNLGRGRKKTKKSKKGKRGKKSRRKGKRGKKSRKLKKH